MWSTLESGTRVDFILHVLKKKFLFFFLSSLAVLFFSILALLLVPFSHFSLHLLIYESSLAPFLTLLVSEHHKLAPTLPQLRTRAQFFDNTAFKTDLPSIILSYVIFFHDPLLSVNFLKRAPIAHLKFFLFFYIYFFFLFIYLPVYIYTHGCISARVRVCVYIYTYTAYSIVRRISTFVPSNVHISLVSALFL